MFKKNIFLLLFIFFSFSSLRGQVEIKDGWFYVDGEKFIVKGIGFETHTRPGQVPWIYQFDPQLIRYDLKRIKDAGFNTIRTWGALHEEELQLVEESGLKIIFGIWIDPHGDYQDATFVQSAVQHLKNVLNYSKKYDSIIGYLIMNEPVVEDVYSGGAAALVNLWEILVNLIHQEHPGIPVSFSNSPAGDYIRSDIFDFVAYNLYIYNPVTISNSHGYQGFIKFLKKYHAPDKPLIITEFGLSVSPKNGQDYYGYGGNSLLQQSSGNLLMQKGLINGGAQGGCVFQYHDGWWKGGNENSHDNNPEEWFGLIGFSNINDQYGTPRPAWYTASAYNRAIVTSPENGEIYQQTIPLEIFFHQDVQFIKISHGDSLLFEKEVPDPYLSRSLDLMFSFKDVVLDFEFYDSDHNIIKRESRTILVVDDVASLDIPDLELRIQPDGITPNTSNYFSVTVLNNQDRFEILNDKLDYVFHPHIGFNPGEARNTQMNLSNNTYYFSDQFIIPADCRVATFGAGFTVRHGHFEKRIFDQKILFNGNWADAIAADQHTFICEDRSILPVNHNLYPCYPNPFNSSTRIEFYISRSASVKIQIFNILGMNIKTLIDESMSEGFHSINFDAEGLSSGLYFYHMQTRGFEKTGKMVIF